MSDKLAYACSNLQSSFDMFEKHIEIKTVRSQMNKLRRELYKMENDFEKLSLEYEKKYGHKLRF